MRPFVWWICFHQLEIKKKFPLPNPFYLLFLTHTDANANSSLALPPSLNNSQWITNVPFRIAIGRRAFYLVMMLLLSQWLCCHSTQYRPYQFRTCMPFIVWPFFSALALIIYFSVSVSELNFRHFTINLNNLPLLKFMAE